MLLPPTFQFSATSLQDYIDCPRRFQLRYLFRVAWPAPEAEPIYEQEHRIQLARDFHRLAHQHLLGLPAERLSASIQDLDLERWWQAYLAYVATLHDARLIPEVGLSVPIAGYRVIGRYDAVAVWERSAAAGRNRPSATAGRGASLLIIDWKTYKKRPSRQWLSQRLQTRVYPAVLVQAGAALVRRSLIEPEDVELCYWMADYPQAPEVFSYDAATYQADLDYLAALITEIVGRIDEHVSNFQPAEAIVSDTVWPLTTNRDMCRFCNYRSLCNRGSVAGHVDDYAVSGLEQHSAGDELGLDYDLDWGQVQEIAY